jgi:hypothetical protein
VSRRPRYCPTVRSRPTVWLGVPLAMTLALTACGSGSSSTGSDTASSRGTATTSDSAPPGSTAIQIVRTGGIGGVRDTVKVTSDGSARLTTKDGRTRGCRPSGKALARLRAMDLAAVAAAPKTGPQVADGFTYTVSVGSKRAAGGEGDEDGRRADLVDAAAAVLTSCLQGQSGPVGY